MDYINRVCKSPFARRVKIADLRDNLDLSRLNLDDIPKYKSLIKREQKALAYCLGAEHNYG
jgi:hypothetical protein